MIKSRRLVDWRDLSSGRFAKSRATRWAASAAVGMSQRCQWTTSRMQAAQKPPGGGFSIQNLMILETGCARRGSNY